MYSAGSREEPDWQGEVTSRRVLYYIILYYSLLYYTLLYYCISYYTIIGSQGGPSGQGPGARQGAGGDLGVDLVGVCERQCTQIYLSI